jgi:hypothetical protein
MPALTWLNDQLLARAAHSGLVPLGRACGWWPPMPRYSCRRCGLATASAASADQRLFALYMAETLI